MPRPHLKKNQQKFVTTEGLVRIQPQLCHDKFFHSWFVGLAIQIRSVPCTVASCSAWYSETDLLHSYGANSSHVCSSYLCEASGSHHGWWCSWLSCRKKAPFFLQKRKWRVFSKWLLTAADRGVGTPSDYQWKAEPRVGGEMSRPLLFPPSPSPASSCTLPPVNPAGSPRVCRAQLLGDTWGPGGANKNQDSVHEQAVK